jgi:KipI family sensor histidine kinase inhibitor
MNCLAYGDRGVLLSALSDAERAALILELESDRPPGCGEFVLGYDSILLIGSRLEATREWLGRRRADRAIGMKAVRRHTIAVKYDGADLKAVAKATGMDVAAVIERHSAPTYRVRMMGFSPGFPYLEGLDPRLHLERRDSPRTQIPPGSVAIGGPHAGIYSVASPGGWHLLGQTEFPLFKLKAAREAYPDPAQVFALNVGDQVRFQPIPA